MKLNFPQLWTVGTIPVSCDKQFMRIEKTRLAKIAFSKVSVMLSFLFIVDSLTAATQQTVHILNAVLEKEP
jgi:hypothetical protein